MTYATRLEAEALYPCVTSAGRDFKAWAKRIVYRHEHSDKSLYNIQIPFAYAALGMPQPKDPDAI
jgi:hypothetical protein